MTEGGGARNGAAPTSPWRRRGRRAAAGLALGGGIATVAVIVISTGSPGQIPSAHATAGVTGAVAVQRRNLVATDTQSGTLSYADPAVVYNRLSGTITWLPKVGQLIAPGQPLFRINDQPVILMSGSTPAYRDLTPSDSAGPDITELNRNLVALGFDPSAIVVDDVWQAATTAGVELFQASLGETETGSLSLGHVVFLPGPRLIATVNGTVGSTGGGSGSGSPAATRLQLTDPGPEFVDLTRTSVHSPAPRPRGTSKPPSGGRKPRQGSHTPTPRPPAAPSSSRQLDALIALLQAELAQLKNNRPASPAPAKPSSSAPASPTPSGGGGGAGAVEILQTTSDRLVVKVNLPASSQAEATVGERVTVQTPGGSTVNGVITQVSSVAQSSSSGNGGGNGAGGNGSSPTVPVTIALRRASAGARLDQASVSVHFVQASARNVLCVPVTALLATSGTTYAVQTAAAPHRLIPVNLGLFAAGYVQISGPGIVPGLQVTDSQG